MLIQQIRQAVADPGARSFRVVGDDFHALTFADLKRTVAAYEAASEAIPPSLRRAVAAEHEAHAREVHVVLRATNRDVYQRVRGYLAIARRTGFELVWPTVAALGISQILDGAGGFRVASLFGEWAQTAGYDGISELSAVVDDMVRRANRAIYADSMSTSLLALRCVALRRRGRDELADALLDGPPPLTMDEQSFGVVRALDGAARIDDGEQRFAALVRIAFQEFEREQAALGYHMGGGLELPGAPRWLSERLAIRTVTVPVVDGERLWFRKVALPKGFDLRDHQARVEGPGRAFFDGVTRSTAELRVAVAYVVRRFERGAALVPPAFQRGGLPLAAACPNAE